MPDTAVEPVREDYVRLALESYPSMRSVIAKMTEAELHAALELESATNRRATIINRMIGRLIALQTASYRRQLQERYHAP